MAAGAALADGGGVSTGISSSLTVRGLTLSRSDLAAGLLVALTAASVAVVLAGGALTGADLAAQVRARDESLLSAASDPGVGPGGPLARAVVWSLAHWAPFDQRATAVVAVLSQALLVLALWAVLRRVVGRRGLALPLLVVAVVSPALLVVATDAVRVVPVLISAAAVLAALAVHQRPPARLAGWPGALAVAVVVAVGVGADLSALAAALVLAAASATRPGPRAPRRRNEMVRVLAATVAAAIAGAVSVLLHGAPAGAGRIDPDVLINGLGRAAAGVVGAPWSWDGGAQLPAPGQIPAYVPWLVAGVVAAAVAAAFTLRPRRSGAAVGLTASWVVVAALTAGHGDRAAWSLAATTTVALLAGLAFIAPPPRRRWSGAEPRPAGRTLGGRVRSRAGQAPVLIVCLAGLTAGGLAAASYARAVSTNPVRPWLSTVRASLAGLPPFPRILPRAVPTAIRPGSGALDVDAPLISTLRPDALLQDADGPMLTLGDDGHLGPALPGRLAASAPAGLCAGVVQPGDRRPARVPLTAPTPLPAGSLVRLAVLVKDTTALEVSTEDSRGARQPVLGRHYVLYPGPHTAIYVASGSHAVAVLAAPTTPEAGLCVVSAEIVRQP
jgi:hypothetical protein